MNIDQNGKDKLNKALEQFEYKFNFSPYFDGMTVEQMKDDRFIELINQAIDNDNPNIDLTDYFPDGRNLQVMKKHITNSMSTVLSCYYD